MQVFSYQIISLWNVKGSRSRGDRVSRFTHYELVFRKSQAPLTHALGKDFGKENSTGNRENSCYGNRPWVKSIAGVFLSWSRRSFIFKMNGRPCIVWRQAHNAVLFCCVRKLCLFQSLCLCLRETVLVTAAAGATGLAAIDIAANVLEAKVFPFQKWICVCVFLTVVMTVPLQLAPPEHSETFTNTNELNLVR